MHRVSALYANSDGARFDFEYYRHMHFPMVLELLKPFGALRFEIDRGLASPDGSKPPFVAAGHLIVASAELLGQGLAMHGARMAADVTNFTDIVAQLQVSEIIL
jgi:uncharacterized protein (TIGR02118 family)